MFLWPETHAEMILLLKIQGDVNDRENREADTVQKLVDLKIDTKCL
jgi:hypothetical protein